MRISYLALSAGTLLGTAYPLIVWSLESFSAFEIALGRAAIATVFIVAVSRKEVNRIIISRNQFGSVMGLSLIGVSIFWILLNFGTEFSSPNQTSFLVSTYPLLSSLLAKPLLKENLSKMKIMGIILGFAGAALIFSEGKLTTVFTTDDTLGKAAAIGASLSWSFYMLLSRRLISSKRVRPDYLAFNSVLLALPILFTMSFLFPQAGNRDVTFNSIFGLIWLGIVVSAIGFLLVNKAVQNVNMSTVSSHLMIFPVITVLTSYLLLGEIPIVMELIGGALVLLGVAVARL